jgi:hypothetical protein
MQTAGTVGDLLLELPVSGLPNALFACLRIDCARPGSGGVLLNTPMICSLATLVRLRQGALYHSKWNCENPEQMWTIARHQGAWLFFSTYSLNIFPLGPRPPIAK